MKWFKHDSDASSDAKIKKLIIRHGAPGYAIYFHCIELITGDISESNLTFELEHDSEIIADNLKIKGDAHKSGIETTEEIMKTIIDLGLFQEIDNRVFCLKLAKRLDTSMTSREGFRQKIKKCHDRGMTQSCKKRIEETITEDKTKEEEGEKNSPAKKIKYLDCVLLTDNEHKKLVAQFGQKDTDEKIERVNNYVMSKGAKYKSHYHTVLSWHKRDNPGGLKAGVEQQYIEEADPWGK